MWWNMVVEGLFRTNDWSKSVTDMSMLTERNNFFREILCTQNHQGKQ